MKRIVTESKFKSEVLRRKQGEPLPICAFIEVTNACNLSCKHCYLQDVSDSGMLSVSEYADMFNQFRAAGVFSIVFTGGEMFCRPEIFEIIELARQAGLFYSFLSNGTLIDDSLVRSIKAANPLSVGISIYGSNARTHDSITRHEGSFERSLAAVKMLSQAGLSVTIKTSVMRSNFREINEIQTIADEVGADYAPDPLLAPAINGATNHLDERLSNQDFKAFMLMRKWRICRDDRKQDPSSSYLMCSAGRSKFAVAPNGEIFPCVIWRASSGNIKDKYFLDIWEGDFLQTIRSVKDASLRECSSCRISQVCIRCPGFAYMENSDFLGPSSEVCRMASILAEVVNCG